jgi:hypothetical protein
MTSLRSWKIIAFEVAVMRLVGVQSANAIVSSSCLVRQGSQRSKFVLGLLLALGLRFFMCSPYLDA